MVSRCWGRGRREEAMVELSKEELIIINRALIIAKNQTETENFAMHKLMIDSSCSSNHIFYDHLLRKIEDEIKNMDIPDRFDPK